MSLLSIRKANCMSDQIPVKKLTISHAISSVMHIPASLRRIILNYRLWFARLLKV